MFNNIKGIWHNSLSLLDHHFVHLRRERALIDITSKESKRDILPGCIGSSAGVDPEALWEWLLKECLSLSIWEVIVEYFLGVFEGHSGDAFLEHPQKNY